MVESEICTNFALANGKQRFPKAKKAKQRDASAQQLSRQKGAVVQLVRIQACHAWGRGFESRPHRRGERKSSMVNFGFLLLFFRAFIDVRHPDFREIGAEIRF